MQELKFSNCFEIQSRLTISATSLSSFLSRPFLTFQKQPCSSQPMGMLLFPLPTLPLILQAMLSVTSQFIVMSPSVFPYHMQNVLMCLLYSSLPPQVLNKLPGSSQMFSIKKIYFASLCSRKDLKCLIEIIANIIEPLTRARHCSKCLTRFNSVNPRKSIMDE